MRDAVIHELQQFIELIPFALSNRICNALETSENWYQVKLDAVELLHSPILSDHFTRIITRSQQQGILPDELAFAFRSALAVEVRRREAPRLELIWTGPVFSPYNLRRTDETILQLIQQATRRLTLVSFALYRVDRISQALKGAVDRGVGIRIFMETDKVKAPDLRALYGDVLATTVQFYSWSHQHDDQKTQGQSGVLHAKAVIADNEQLFISSANLTEYAMSLNIELGILVHGGHLPGKTDKMFDEYVERGVFTPYFLL
jgi:phosphatidylserine/phosphatidylglycerophosphate/cardiolipin synthase-like enzyme